MPLNAIGDLPVYDISNEAYREYVFPSGTIRIGSPKKLVSKKCYSPSGAYVGDSHRIVAEDENGRPVSYYVPAGWLAIRWYGVGGEEVFDF